MTRGRRTSEDVALETLRVYRAFLDEQKGEDGEWGHFPPLAPTYKELIERLPVVSTSSLHARFGRLSQMGLATCIKRGRKCYWVLTRAGLNYKFEEAT